IDVGVRGQDHLAVRQVEVHQADQLDDLVDGLLQADVDEEELAAAVDEIDVDAEGTARLVVHLDDVREDVFAWEHGRGPARRGVPAGGMIGAARADSSGPHGARRRRMAAWAWMVSGASAAPPASASSARRASGVPTHSRSSTARVGRTIPGGVTASLSTSS